MAKLMSVSYVLVQFVSSSDILNKALYNIFRFYKLSVDNKKNVVELLKFQIMNDGYNHLSIDEDLLFKNKFDNYIKKEIEIDSEDKKEEEIEKEEKNESNLIIDELYNDEIKEENEN